MRPFYFLTFCTHERQRLLAQPEIHEAFVAFCMRAREKNVQVGRYVMMPDHVHLFAVFSVDGMAVPSWIRALRTVMGKRFIELGFSKPHWQPSYFDHVLRSAESYAQKWEYVRQNPVRAGLCPRPEDWPYQGAINSIEF